MSLEGAEFEFRTRKVASGRFFQFKNKIRVQDHSGGLDGVDHQVIFTWPYIAYFLTQAVQELHSVDVKCANFWCVGIFVSV